MAERLNRAIDELEKAEREAEDLLDEYTDELVASEPSGTSWGVVRYKQIMVPAGSRLNYLRALQQWRDRLMGRAVD
jgi:hypothetical protein